MSSPVGRTDGVCGLARALARHGHDVTLYVPNIGARRHTHDSYEIVHVPLRPARPTTAETGWSHTDAYNQFLCKEWSERAPDVAHSHGSIAGLVALLAARGHGIPVVHTHHKPDPERQRIEWLVCRHAAHLLATSGEQVTELCHAGVPRSRISVVPEGVDLDDREDTGLPEPRTGRTRVLGIGDLLPGHGFDTVVTAMAEVRDALLVIAAPIEMNDREANLEANRLRLLARQLGLQDRVTVTGTATRSDVAALLGSADIAVTVPARDLTGAASLQAMAHGLPVIASSVGAQADAVIDQITGRLVPPGDVLTLVRALRGLASDPAKRDAFGTAGADRVRARYGWDRIATDTLTTYERVRSASVRAPSTPQLPSARGPEDGVNHGFLRARSR